jgi:ssDNA-binding Zn-finger/Zn-ribbon topoisomerase 1
MDSRSPRRIFDAAGNDKSRRDDDGTLQGTNVPRSPSEVSCPQCGSAMVLRTAKTGANAGSQFWGCSQFPECRGTRGTSHKALPEYREGGNVATSFPGAHAAWL